MRHRELDKKSKFDLTNEWFMHNSEYVLKYDTQKTLWDFEKQTEHLISAWRADLVIIKKRQRTCQVVDFAFLADDKTK